MIPELFKIGPLSVHSFGLMVGIAFLLGSFILAAELKRRRMDPNIASNVTIIAVVFGLAGAKLLSVIENWPPHSIGDFFSPGGLTWYGGFALGMAAIYVYIRRKKVPYLRFLDCLGIALILAYGVGRIGCHLAGDGDYGLPTRQPWGTIYAEGVAKPSTMLREYFDQHPAEADFWKYDSLRAIPAGIDRRGYAYNQFDATVPMHPTPIYEFILGIIGFVVLRAVGSRHLPDGMVFMIYLLLASIFRFSIEFMRLNPRLVFGLSEAQLIAIGLMMFAICGIIYLRTKVTVPVAKSSS
jgi:phosphatidylglycerol:prolipoprotein diacylglycerol transferase